MLDKIESDSQKLLILYLSSFCQRENNNREKTSQRKKLKIEVYQ